MDDFSADAVIAHQTLTRDDIAALVGAPRALSDCEIGEVDLSGLDLSRWSFERCDLRKTNFKGAYLEGSKWRTCRGAFASFAGCDLTDAAFASSDFNNASFKKAVLEGAKFVGCKLTGADLSEVRALDFHFEETLLINSRLPGLSFKKAKLVRVDFSQADLRKCDFRMSTFEACSLRDALLNSARFEGADLRGADLGGIKLEDASKFRGATISREQSAQLLGELGVKVR